MHETLARWQCANTLVRLWVLAFQDGGSGLLKCIALLRQILFID